MMLWRLRACFVMVTKHYHIFPDFFEFGIAAIFAAILSMNLKIPVQYSFLGLQGMTSKVHIVPKNREHQKVLHLSGFGPCSNEKAAKKCLAGTISQKKLLSELVGNATFSLFWQGFCPSFSILRIAASIDKQEHMCY